MTNIPTHVAIIPDGNRRWAKEKGLPTLEGHRRGFDQISKIAKRARDLGVKILTIWAFSTENWNRTGDEVNYLMKLYEIMIEKNLKKAMRDKIRLIHVGRKDRLNERLRSKIIEAENATRDFDKYYFVIALDYGGQDEVMRAIKKVEGSPLRQGFEGQAKFKVQGLEEKDFEKFLDTKDLPNPNVDLIIRTSGEMRTSGFMIWQAAYAEYIFSPKYFPDFTQDDFEDCVKEYEKRQRRFGS